MESKFAQVAALAMARRYDSDLDRMMDGWDETLPRTFWQRLFRRPATVVHHKGMYEL